ncbi:ankyrin repeat domain-containing protein [candidate division KSB1 bacterium]
MKYFNTKIKKVSGSTIIVFMIFLLKLQFCIAGEIHDAAKNGNLDKVKTLLAANPGLLNSKDNRGNTPIHSAVSKGRTSVISFLIEKGAEINSKNKNGLTPLFMALDMGRNNAAKILIEKGADLQFTGYLRRTLLHMAARAGNTEIIFLLIEKGADVNAKDSKGSTPLDIAVFTEKAGAAKLLLDKGGEFNAAKPLTYEFESLLNKAVRRGKTDLVKFMIDVGGDVNSTDESGYTKLQNAAASGQIDVVSLLLERGVNVTGKGENRKTPLQLAVEHGHKDIYDMLISKGASIPENIKANFGNSTFLASVLKDSEAYIWYLGHGGWAVKTKEHLLVFDYIEPEKKPAYPFISNGNINPEEIKDLDVTVFISHEHNDHFDRTIFNWEKTVTNINYVFGFTPRRINTSNFEIIEPRESKVINGMEVLTIRSSDSGVGFLVKTDGLKIFHGGDHANTGEVLKKDFTDEIDYLVKDHTGMDIAFMLSGSACGGGGSLETVRKGLNYFVQNLKPGMFFPMHSQDGEHVYKIAAAEIDQMNLSSICRCAEFRGDRFIYNSDVAK